MLSTLITSKTRIKLLLKFFLNPNNRGYLKNLEMEFEDSSNGIRLELNKFESAGLLVTENVGNKKYFKANTKHYMFQDIHNILLKFTGIDLLIESVIEQLGNVDLVYLVGSLARGLESNIIDIIIIGDINKEYLIHFINKVEPLIGRRIRYIIYTHEEFLVNKSEILNEDHLLIWNKIN